MANPKVITIAEETETGGAAPGGIDFGKVIRYGQLVMNVIETVESAQEIEVGAAVELEEVEIRRKGRSFLWDMGSISRTK